MSPLAKVRGLDQLRRPQKVSAARWVAWVTLWRTFDQGAYADRAFTAAADNEGLHGRDRAFAQYLAFGTIQRAATLDYLIAATGKRPVRKLDAPVLHALRVGLFQLVLSDGVADHAAVHQSVELVRASVGERAVAFTNAVLRRAQVDAAGLLAKLDPSVPADAATLHSFPEWLVRHMHDAFGADGIAALAAQNEAPAAHPFRCNLLKDTPTGAVERVREAGATLAETTQSELRALVPDVVLVQGSSESLTDSVEAGVLVPQSLSSALVAHVLAPEPGEHVFDLCSAPGGKTTHIAGLMGNRGTVEAWELHPHRASSVSALAERCAATCIQVHVGDATEIEADRSGCADRVLVDAPCTGTGVLGRRPDARWKRDEADIDELVNLQRRLLASAAQLVRPGGQVVYSTCSLLPHENEQVVEWATAELDLEPIPVRTWAPAPATAELVPRGGTWTAEPLAGTLDGSIRIWPGRHDSDGFFIARMQRTR